MAPNAIEVGAPWRTFWQHLTKVSPERWEFTTRLALICALTTLIAEIYQTPEPALTAYVAFFLNRPERATSLILSVALTVVISLVIGLVFVVAKVVLDDPLWRVASIALISFGLLFLASASKLRPVAGTVALIVGYALDVLGTIQVGEEGTRALLYAWLLVAIPAGVSLVVNLALAPSPRRIAERAIAAHLQQCAAFLREPESPRVREDFRECAQSGVEAIREHLKLASTERSASRRDLAALEQASLSTAALTSALEVMQSHPQVDLPRETRHAIAATLDDMAEILARGGYPVEITAAWPPAGTTKSVALSVLAALRDAVHHFADPSIQKVGASPQGFFLIDAFTNPEHVYYALKTTGAAVFCYCLYSLLNWPGIHTCFLTCYIVAQSTAAESVEKLTLRIVGCLIGAAAGVAAIVYLVPSLTSIGGLLLAVFGGAWIAAYLAAGSPRISYAGFQLAFAFFLCVIQGVGPQFDLTIARDRIIGILLGNFVAYIAFVHIWPMSICRRIDPAIASALRRLQDLVLTRSAPDRLLIATEVISTLSTAQTDLSLAHYEPFSIRATDHWLMTRREVIEQSRVLSPLLLLGHDQRDISHEIVGRRLAALAARILQKDADIYMGASSPPTGGSGVTLSLLIEEELARAEQTLRGDASQPGALGHADN